MPEKIHARIVEELSQYYSVVVLKQFYELNSTINLVIIRTNSIGSFRLNTLLQRIFSVRPVIDKYGAVQGHINNFTVNMYFTTPSNSDLVTYYHNYNSWGYLLNLLAKQYDYKLNTLGLYNNDQLITQNVKVISNLLDVNYNNYEVGFRSSTELFKAITNSTAYTARRFIIKDLNRTPTILLKFVQYINDNYDAS